MNNVTQENYRLAIEALQKLKESHYKLYSMLTPYAKTALINYDKFPSVIAAEAAINKAKQK